MVRKPPSIRPAPRWCALLALPIAACGRSDARPDAARAALEAPRDDAASRAEIWTVVQGRASFLLHGQRETARGVAAVSGRIVVDFGDLRRTRGEIAVDLASVKTTSFEDPARDEQQTAEARRWLGAGSAIFTFDAVETAEPRDLTAASGALREARLGVAGTLALRDYAAPCASEIEARVAFEGDRARTLHARTIADLRVDLAAHGIPPRDAAQKDRAESGAWWGERLPIAEVAVVIAAAPRQD